MASQTKYASVTAFVGSGSDGFNNPNNILTSNDIRATGKAVIKENYLCVRGLSFTLPATAVIQGIAVEIEGRRGSTNPAIRVWLTDDGSSTGISSSYYNAVTNNKSEVWETVGGSSVLWGESWTPTIVNSANFGVLLRKTNTADTEVQLDCLRVTVYYVEQFAIYLECDRETNPAMASDAPLFSAVFSNSDINARANQIQIEVSTDPAFGGNFLWQSGTIDIAQIRPDFRCEEIPYDGNSLSTGVTYHWRCRFGNTGVFWDWSIESATFLGLRRPWEDASFTHRRKVLWPASHQEIPAGYTQSLSFKTGNRRVIADDGYFNESIQASGGFQVLYRDGKTHVVYLATLGANLELEIKIVTKDHQTGEWGQPFTIIGSGTYFDTHYFPSACIDREGYIHVFYGCHYNTLRYVRSAQPNVSGSLPGDPTENVWIRPSQLPSLVTGYDTISGATMCTYPVVWLIPETGRVYMYYRYGGFDNSFSCRFHYSDNNGQTWSSVNTFIYDTYNKNELNCHQRVYLYGFRYDEKRQRLHCAFALYHFFGGSPYYIKGIWYVYSDLDETDGNCADVGFNIWHWADGTLAGKTNDGAGYTPVLANNTTQWAANVAKAVEFHALDAAETEPMYHIMIEDLELTKSGEAVVFYAMRIRNADVRDESHLCCARWNGTSWSITRISDQLDTLIRTTRSGLGLQTDGDGVMHAFMAVDGQTYRRIPATGDDDSVGVTRSSGDDNFALIDDGFTLCDGNATYLTLAAAGKASFTHGGAVSSDDKILGVAVEVVARASSGSTSVCCYLDSGTSESDGSTISLYDTYWTRQTHLWRQNPFTAADWEVGDLTGLRFGLKNPHASVPFRVTRVVLMVLVTRAVDAEYKSVEVVELTSQDDGANWAVREITRNSSLGVPIMQRKHHLTNGRIEIVWSAGTSIFYYTDDEPFGLVQKTGNDLRLYYGSTEIHRLLDHANLDESTVMFALPDAVAANRIAPPHDLFLYYGDKNNTSEPLADPHEVIGVFFENFESYADGEDIDGQNGWDVVSGLTSVYGSPPQDTNRVYAGNNSVQCDVDGANLPRLERVLGSGLIDLLICASGWMDQPLGDGKLVMEVEDSVGTTFGVGIDTATDYAGTDDDGVWTASSKRATNAGYYEFIILVTASGCSAWVNGTQILSNGGSISSVNKLILRADSTCWWDFVRVMQVLDVDPVLQAPEVHGLAVGGIILGAGRRLLYIGASIEGTLLNVVKQVPIMASGWAGAAKELPASIEGTLLNVVRQPAEYLSVVKVDSLFPVGARTAAGGSFVGLPVASLRGLLPRIDIPVYWNGTLQIERTCAIPIDFLGSVVTERHLPSDFAAGHDSEHVLRVSFFGGLAACTGGPMAWHGGLQVNGRHPVEALCGQTMDAARLLFQSLAGVVRASSAPTELLGAITRPIRVPLGWVGGVTCDDRTPLEALGGHATSAFRLLLEALAGSAHASSTPTEGLSGLGRVIQSPLAFDGAAVLESARSFPIGWTVTVDPHASNPVEVLPIGMSALRSPIEARATAEVAAAVTLDWLAALEANRILRVETSSEVRATIAAQLAAAASIRVDAQLPTEFEASGEFSIFASLPICWQRTLVARQSAPLDIQTNIEVIAGRVLCEWGTIAGSERQLPTEHLEMARVAAQFMADWLGQVDARGLMQLHWLNTTEPVIRMRVEFGSGAIIRTAEFPVERLVALFDEIGIPVYWRGIALLAVAMSNVSLSTVQMSNLSLATMRLASLALAELEAQGVSLAVPDMSASISKVELTNPTIIGGGADG